MQELFGYWQVGESDASAVTPGRADATELTDKDLLGITGFMGQPGPMSEQMKDMIRWCEEQKSKHRVA